MLSFVESHPSLLLVDYCPFETKRIIPLKKKRKKKKVLFLVFIFHFLFFIFFLHKMSFDIIDAEQCFSKDLTPYHLIQGEFNLLKPYFYANQESPKKKKRKTTPSKADIETAKRHEELRPILMNCLNELKICWKEKNQVEPKEKKGEKNEIDFPSIQQMVEKAQMRFSDEQIYEKIDLVDMIYKDLDIFSVFNKICMNNTDQLKLLEITPTATYLIPPQSTFIMGSMTDGSLEQLSEHGKRKS